MNNAIQEAEVLQYTTNADEVFNSIQPNADGNVTVTYQQWQLLLAERKQYRADVTITVGLIRKLLTQLGILNSYGQIQFRFSALTKIVGKLSFSPSAAEKEFGYLADLGDVIGRYKDVTI